MLLTKTNGEKKRTLQNQIRETNGVPEARVEGKNGVDGRQVSWLKKLNGNVGQLTFPHRHRPNGICLA